MLSPDLQALLPAIRALYDHPPRAYHNWSHIEFCLGEFRPIVHLCQNPLAVELAIYFHDCIYDPVRHDNEEQSADTAARMLAANVPAPIIATIRSLILDTRHTAPPVSPDGRYLVDIDLSILGRPTAEFDGYEHAIRQEYAHVAPADFARGRAAILRQFLSRPMIYLTPHFHERYEKHARANLDGSIKNLTDPS